MKMSKAPDFTAALPTNFGTGQPIPEGFTVFSWDYQNGRWYAVMTSNIKERAEDFVEGLKRAHAGVARSCYRIERVK